MGRFPTSAVKWYSCGMKLHHVALTVRDLEESEAFYTKNFGLTVVHRFTKPEIGARAVFLSTGNSHIELWSFDDKKLGELTDLGVTGMKHIAFQTEDVEAEYTRLVANGLECHPVKTGTSGGTYFFTHDSDGNQIEIYENSTLQV